MSEFDGAKPRARKTDPKTSHQAAYDAKRKFSQNMRTVLVLLFTRGPLTDYDLQRITGKQKNSIGKRRTDLCHLGYAAEFKRFGVGQTKQSPVSRSECTLWRPSGWGAQWCIAHPDIVQEIVEKYRDSK